MKIPLQKNIQEHSKQQSDEFKEWGQAKTFTDQRQSFLSTRKPALPLGPDLQQVGLDADQGNSHIQPSVAQSHSELEWPRRTESLLNLYLTYVIVHILISLGTSLTSLSHTDQNPQTMFPMWEKLRMTSPVMVKGLLPLPRFNTCNKMQPYGLLQALRDISSGYVPSHCNIVLDIRNKKKKKQKEKRCHHLKYREMLWEF